MNLACVVLSRRRLNDQRRTSFFVGRRSATLRTPTLTSLDTYHAALLSMKRLRFVAVDVYPTIVKESLYGFRVRARFLTAALIARIIPTTPCQLTHHNPFSVRIHYVSQEKATCKEGFVHVRPDWRHSGPRRGCNVARPLRNYAIYFHIFICLASSVWPDAFHLMAFVRPHHRPFKRSKLSRYMKLTDRDGRCEPMLADSLIHHAHVLPPTRTRLHPVAQEIEKGSYLHLHRVK